MKYKDAIKKTMESLARDDRVIFLGYNINYGSYAYGTLKDVPREKCIEMPLAENLMTGLAMGMSLEGYRPIVFFERHDFMLNALDEIVNHLDKISKLSHNQFFCPVIIRAVVGSTKPIYPGLQHTQDYTDILKRTLSFPVIELKDSEQIIREYKNAIIRDSPTLLVEKRDLYDLDN